MLPKLSVVGWVPLIFMLVQNALAATEDLGNGFLHHGVATPVSNHRGTVATVDGEGRNVVLMWLMDHRGGYALLMIDAETGEATEFPMPFPPGGDSPYASILSSRNRFYTHFNSHFCEFDPVKREFTFFTQTAPQMAMSMTEDDEGRIWSATYPNSGLVSYDPKTGEFKDYGHVHRENWAQYPRSIAADDTGWIYFGIGSTNSQILMFDPATGMATPVVAEQDRGKGYGTVYRDLNGKVYGTVEGAEAKWYELYEGKGRLLDQPPAVKQKPIVTGSQGLFHREFPDGKQLRSCDLVDRVLVVEDPKTGERKQLSFDYTSEGAHIMGLAVAPDGTICGGTAFPMRFFSYNPTTDTWVNRASYGQWNTVARQGDRFFVGGYG
ncbi:MAG: Vgb family protein, partial [Candidatus Zipacnadales bacterium]